MANYILHEHAVFRVIYKMLSPFISKEMKEKLILCGEDYTILQKHIDAQCIPVEFGGEWRIDDNQFTDEFINEINDKVKAYWEKYPVISKKKK